MSLLYPFRMSTSGTTWDPQVPLMTTHAAFPFSHTPAPNSTGILPYYSAYRTPSTPVTPTPLDWVSLLAKIRRFWIEDYPFPLHRRYEFLISRYSFFSPLPSVFTDWLLMLFKPRISWFASLYTVTIKTRRNSESYHLRPQSYAQSNHTPFLSSQQLNSSNWLYNRVTKVQHFSLFWNVWQMSRYKRRSCAEYMR